MDQPTAEGLMAYVQDNIPRGEPFVVLCVVDDFPAVLGSVSSDDDPEEAKARIAAYLIKTVMFLNQSVASTPDALGQALDEVKRIYEQRSNAPWN